MLLKCAKKGLGALILRRNLTLDMTDMISKTMILLMALLEERG